MISVAWQIMWPKYWRRVALQYSRCEPQDEPGMIRLLGDASWGRSSMRVRGKGESPGTMPMWRTWQA
jgi:hypothetical protein